MFSKLAFFVIFFFVFQAPAGVLVGSGFNSATASRLVPALNLGVGGQSFEAILSSTGVSTTAYSHSAYKLGGYWTWKAGDFLLGQIEAGFGAGAFYAVRSFTDTGAAKVTKSDYVLGPAFFVRWVYFDTFFLAVDSLYGLVGPSNRYGDLLGLNARDNVNLIIGFRL